MKIEDVFKRVRSEVRRKSGGSQVPEERSSLEGDFYFARGSMVVEEPPVPSAIREPAMGRLTVRSNVGGAKVYIDDVYEGEAPVSATLKPGMYSITLKKAGYLDAAETVRVETGDAKTISIVMEKPAPPPEDARTFTSPTLGAAFALIPSGTFMMGSPNDESGRYDSENQHQVTISRPFYMQTTEVTQGQWQKVMGSNPSQFSSCGNDCPVERVSWNDVQEFIRKLNSMEGTDRYRLPTEAQWEYAARAGTTTRFYSGDKDDDLSRAGWYGGNSGSKTHPVSLKTLNAWGLYDMHGNVWEWVQDREGYYPAGNLIDPEGPSSGSFRVVRGGCWDVDTRVCRSAFRGYGGPGSRVGDLGFRLLKTVAASDSAFIDTSTSVSGARETGRDGRFIAYDNGTVLDTRTNLMWAAKDNGADINWQNAKSYCENYRDGGYTDWRMPTQDELAGLFDSSKSYKAKQRDYNIHLTELILLSACCPWASETRGSETALFDFLNGGRYWFRQSFGSVSRALPVRSGK